METADADEIIVPLCIIIICAGLHQRGKKEVLGEIMDRGSTGEVPLELLVTGDQSFHLLCLPVLFYSRFFGNCIRHASFTELFTNINTSAMTPCPGFSFAICQ